MVLASTLHGNIQNLPVGRPIHLPHQLAVFSHRLYPAFVPAALGPLHQIDFALISYILAIPGRDYSRAYFATSGTNYLIGVPISRLTLLRYSFIYPPDLTGIVQSHPYDFIHLARGVQLMRPNNFWITADFIKCFLVF